MWVKGLPEPPDWNFFLRSMDVNRFYIPNPEIRMLPSNALQLFIKDASIQMNGKWKSRKNVL